MCLLTVIKGVLRRRLLQITFCFIIIVKPSYDFLHWVRINIEIFAYGTVNIVQYLFLKITVPVS